MYNYCKQGVTERTIFFVNHVYNFIRVGSKFWKTYDLVLYTIIILYIIQICVQLLSFALYLFLYHDVCECMIFFICIDSA